MRLTCTEKFKCFKPDLRLHKAPFTLVSLMLEVENVLSLSKDLGKIMFLMFFH